MTRPNKFSLCVFSLSLFLVNGSLALGSISSISLDKKLTLIINEFDLRSLQTKAFEETAKYRLGQALFFDPILSGNLDVSCSTCHLIKYGSSDGLQLSIGVGGVGLGEYRKPVSSREVHPRNSMDLWNRDHNDFSSMFWDGRVEMIDPINRVFRSPLGDDLPSGLDNAMAAQALFPLISPNEMLGYPGDQSSAELPTEFSTRKNELAEIYIDTRDPMAHASEIYRLIIRRLVGEANRASNTQLRYQELFEAAYPEAPIRDVNITHVANALAHFEELAFATRTTLWDSYLAGDPNALTQEAKLGAVLFYGKGRCASCHSGQLQSDFDFHAIGVIDSSARISENNRDRGRQAATGLEADAFKFRTPPLRNVLLTAPYFHNGSARDIESAVRHHTNPLRNANSYHESGKFLMTGKQTDAISPILQAGLELNDSEIYLIIAFLSSLTYEISDQDLERIVPSEVPSKINLK